MAPPPAAHPENPGVAFGGDYVLCRAHWDLAALEEGAARALLRLALQGARHTAPPAPALKLGGLLPILPPWMPQGLPAHAMPPPPGPSYFHHCAETLAPWPPPADQVPPCIDVPFASDGRILDHDDPEDDLSLFLGAEHFWNVGHPSHMDLAHVSRQDVAVLADDPDTAGTFPALLHQILSCGAYRDAIAWLPHGRAFAILDEGRFFGEVCPRHFCTGDPGAFLQLVEMSGFAAVVGHPWLAGGGPLAFCHERFIQHRPWLACTMKPFLRHYVPHIPRRADHALGAYLGMLPTLPPTLPPIEAPKLVRHTTE